MRPWFFIAMSLSVLVAPARAAAPASSSDVDPLAQNAALAYWRAFALMPVLDSKDQAAVAAANRTFAPLDDKLLGIARASDSAMRELRRGARYARCAWGVPMEDGPEALLPHLSKTRALARLALLHVRRDIQEGAPAEAVDDLVATMALGRQTSSDGLFVSLLVSYAIAKEAIRVGAAYLSDLGPAELKRLSERIDDLPSLPSTKTVMANEKKYFVRPLIQWLDQPGGVARAKEFMGGESEPFAKLSPEETRETLMGLQTVYDKLAELLDSKSAPTPEAEQKLLSEAHLSGPARTMAQAVLPAFASIQENKMADQARLVMLKAAIAVRLEGESVLSKEAFVDPLGGRLLYEKTPTGFRLESKVTDRDGKPITLEVGRPGKD